MNPDVGTLALFAIAIAMAVVLWELKHSNDPVYRKGCGECDSAYRRFLADQREAIHDVMHRGPKAPGFPGPTKDRWSCDDPNCPRNPPPWTKRP